jgi:KUP system potassium uptake protein
MDSSYFVGRETLLPATKSELGWWQRPIFAFMGGWASSGAEFFHIPPNRAIEIGTQIEI